MMFYRISRDDGYMKVAITKNYTPMFGLPFSGKKANGTYALTGKTSVRVQ